MFGFLRSRRQEAVIDRLHDAIVAAARRPALYGADGFPDSVDGRFEALTLHVLLVLRRLRALPHPAGEVAQELVDSVFSHLEVGLRQTGVGDMGVPKKMKKLGRAFYDRTAKYESALEGRDVGMLATELARRLGYEQPAAAAGLATYLLAAQEALARQDLNGLLGAPDFPDADQPLVSAERGS